MRVRLLSAAMALLGFAALAAVLASAGLIVASEAAWATASVASALAARILGGSPGWKGRLGEFLLLPVAAALVLVEEPTQRTVIVAVLLAVTALTMGTLNLGCAHEERRPACAAAVALALLTANGAALGGYPYWRILLALTPMIAAAATARRAGPTTTLLVATGVLLPVVSAPALVVLPVLLATAAARWSSRIESACHRLMPAIVGIAILCAALGRWGVGHPSLLFSQASWLALVPAGAALVALPKLAPGIVGAGWFLTSLLLGPPQPPPTAGHVAHLTSASPTVSLPAARNGAYHVETSMANASSVRDGTLIATARAGEIWYPLRAGRDAAEWAFERDDVRAVVVHSLPDDPVWRPSGSGFGAFWAVSGRVRAHDLRAEQVMFQRAAGLPEEVIVTVTAGPAVPMPPRRWSYETFLLAAAAAVGVLQFLGRTWGLGSAIVPWLVLTSASILARVSVVPLQIVLEKHSVDVALAALTAAWLPAARRWLAGRRFMLAAATLLVPVALATPYLTPSLYGDEPYHLLILDALSRGASLSEAVAAGAPSGLAPMHGPLLAVLLLPGYLVAGRGGALALLAFGAAGVVALVAHRARALGVSASRIAILAGLMVTTAPLATYASQVWPEVPGALAVAGGLVMAAGPSVGRWIPVITAALAGAVETRLALVSFPVAIAAVWPRRRGVGSSARAIVFLGTAAAGVLGAAWLFLGHALGAPRDLASLIPRSGTKALLAVGGLLFDPSGGLAIAAPLMLAALLGLPRLWHSGARGERAALAGIVLTILALLHSVEWYGGGSPPARYVVAGMPVIWLAGAMLVRRPPPGMSAAPLLMPLALLSTWTLISRPQFSVNSGNGRFWVSDLLAERFRTDTRHLVPSFLVPSSATWLFPLTVLVVVIGISVLAHRRPALVRAIGRQVAAIWLTAVAMLAAHLALRHDRVVEIEDPQVQHLGGRPEPPPGTWSTYLYPGGWRLADGDEVVIPLRIQSRSKVTLVGWLDGPARQECSLEARWQGGTASTIRVAGEGTGFVELAAPASAGRHTLHITLRAPAQGEAVFDRLVVSP